MSSIYGKSDFPGSGKTSFIQDILRRRMITDFPEKIFYFYKVYQPFMGEWNSNAELPTIEFVEGLELDRVKDYGGNCTLVIDDLLINKQKATAEFFIFYSHHLDVTVFFLTQTLYPRDEYFRLMLLNSHYLVIFSDIRSMRQVRTLASQLFGPDEKDRLLNAYKKSIKEPYSFVVLNFVQSIPRELTVITDFWSKIPSVFL